MQQIAEIQQDITPETPKELKNEEWKDIGSLSRIPKIIKNARHEILNIKELETFYIYNNWLNMDSLDGEIWRDIEEYEGKYQVSNLGRVKSLARYEQRSTYKRFKDGRILKFGQYTHDACLGYLFVILCRNAKLKTVKIHKLVAKHFIENPNNLPQVNHKNGIKIDNRVENLEYCNNQYNIKEYIRLNPDANNHSIGSKCGTAILNEEIVYEILEENLKNKLTQYEIAEKFDISQTTIWHIIHGKSWRRVYNKFYEERKQII